MASPLQFYDFRNQPRVAPEIHSEVEVSGVINRSPVAVSDVLIVGQFSAGTPDHLYRNYTLYDDLKAILDPEGSDADVMRLMRLIKTPSPKTSIPGAGVMHAVRPGDPTRATLNLVNVTPVTAIILTSVEYGVGANYNWAKVETGSVTGKKVTLGYKDYPEEVLVGDNLLNVLRVQYTGLGATCTVSVTNATGDAATLLTLTQAVAGDGSTGYVYNLASAMYNTLGKLCNAIANRTGYTCTFYGSSDVDISLMPSSTLDALIAVDCKANPVNIPAGNQSIVYWVNQNSIRCTAAKVATIILQPVTPTASTYFTGGTYPAVVAADYTNALAVVSMAKLPGGYVFIDTSDATTVAAVVTWISSEEGQGRIWKFISAIAGAADAAAIVTAAKARAVILNYRRFALAAQKIFNVEDATEEFEPIFLAAILTGLSSGTGPTTPLSEQAIRCAGIPDDQMLTYTQNEELLNSGVTTIGPDVNNVPIISMAVSSDLGDERMNRMWSEVCAVDYMEINMNVAMVNKKAKWAETTRLASAQGDAINMLEQFKKEGIICDGVDPTSGAAMPAYLPPIITIAGGAMSVNWQGWIGGEIDHIGIKGKVGYATLSTELAL